MKVDFVDKEIKISERLYELTRLGKIKWIQNEIDHFIAEADGLRIDIEFFNFLRADEASTDDSNGTISITLDDSASYTAIAFDFSIGTKQYSYLRMAVLYEEAVVEVWDKHEQKYNDVIGFLDKL